MKKRLLCFALAVLTALSLCAPAMAADAPAPAATSGSCGANVRWSISGRTVTVSGTGRMYDYDIQEESPFFDLGQTKAVVKSGVTYIGRDGFAGSILMESVTLPDTVTAIGDYAFFSCNVLRTVDLGKGLKTIGKYAFYACSSLGDVVLPGTVTSVGEKAFGGGFRGATSVTVTNPKCTIYGDKTTLGTPGRTVIYGYQGSTAETYAKKYGFTFRTLGAQPEKQNGIVTVDGKQYIYKDWEKQTGLVAWDGKTYYCASDGHILKNGWANAGGGRYYYCASDGHIKKGGTLSVGGKTYYVDSTGLRKTGLVTYGGKPHYFSTKDGHLLKNGWINAGGGKRYYADKNGVITKGL